jgi:hypothetical protein
MLVFFYYLYSFSPIGALSDQIIQCYRKRIAKIDMEPLVSLSMVCSLHERHMRLLHSAQKFYPLPHGTISLAPGGADPGGPRQLEVVRWSVTTRWRGPNSKAHFTIDAVLSHKLHCNRLAQPATSAAVIWGGSVVRIIMCGASLSGDKRAKLLQAVWTPCIR